MSPGELHHLWEHETQQLLKELVQTVPPRWLAPLGSDPFHPIYIMQANRALLRGTEPWKAARVVVARRLARDFGRSAITEAARWRPMEMPKIERGMHGRRGRRLQQPTGLASPLTRLPMETPAI